MNVVPVELIDAFLADAPPASAPPRKPPARREAAGSTAGPDAVARCRAYLAKIDAAVSGQHGHDKTFQAARVIWNDFGLDEADGWPLLVEFNDRCQPPWNEGDLRRKWNEAVKKGAGDEGRGHKLNEDRPGYAGRGRDRRAGPRLHEPAGDGPADGPPAGTAGEGPPPRRLPKIVFNGRQYRDVEAEALDALVLANDPPFVFVGNGAGLVDLVRPHADAPIAARELDGMAMRNVFSRVADWFEERVDRKGEVNLIDDYPPGALLGSFPARGDWPGVPPLRSVVTYPVFAPGWEFVAADGYHAGSGLYCDLGGLAVPDVPARPTGEDLDAARTLILDELLGDFPFSDEGGVPGASRANAVALLILPVVRHAIDGPTPLAVIDAPTEGTGKSLLVQATLQAILGEMPEVITPDRPEEELEKMILSLLIEGQPCIFFDNANRKLDSATLCNTLTARFKRGRVLGESRTARCRVNATWALTGNNVTTSREIARRVYWSRIDAGVEDPASRDVQFRHPDLPGWIAANRPLLIWAVAVLVRHWLASGRPPSPAVLGGFEEWSRVIGGVLAAAGIDGFLGNAAAFRRQCSDETGELQEFVKVWHEKYGNQPVIAADLFQYALPLESVLTAETEDGRRKQLGRYLKKIRNRVVGAFRIKVAEDAHGKEIKDYAGRLKYRLEGVDGEASDSASAGGIPD